MGCLHPPWQERLGGIGSSCGETVAGERRSGRDRPAGLQKAVVRAGASQSGGRQQTAVASGCVEQEAGSQDRRKKRRAALGS